MMTMLKILPIVGEGLEYEFELVGGGKETVKYKADIVVGIDLAMRFSMAIGDFCEGISLTATRWGKTIRLEIVDGYIALV